MEILNYKRLVNCYANQNHPQFIVIHETDNTSRGAGAKKHGEAHKNGNLKTSVHYYVDDTYIVQTLDYGDAAWAVGTKYGTPLVPGVHNKNTINIEICVNSDSNYEKARLKCVELVKYLMKKTNISVDHVIRHYDAKKKYCPRKMLDNPALWDDFKKRIREKEMEVKYDMEKLVTYYGDADVFAAIVVAQKNKCPMMKESDYKNSDIKVREIIKIGGTANSNRYQTFKKAAKLI